MLAPDGSVWRDPALSQSSEENLVHMDDEASHAINIPVEINGSGTSGTTDVDMRDANCTQDDDMPIGEFQLNVTEHRKTLRQHWFQLVRTMDLEKGIQMLIKSKTFNVKNIIMSMHNQRERNREYLLLLLKMQDEDYFKYCAILKFQLPDVWNLMTVFEGAPVFAIADDPTNTEIASKCGISFLFQRIKKDLTKVLDVGTVMDIMFQHWTLHREHVRSIQLGTGQAGKTDMLLSCIQEQGEKSVENFLSILQCAYPQLYELLQKMIGYKDPTWQAVLGASRIYLPKKINKVSLNHMQNWFVEIGVLGKEEVKVLQHHKGETVKQRVHFLIDILVGRTICDQQIFYEALCFANLKKIGDKLWQVRHQIETDAQTAVIPGECNATWTQSLNKNLGKLAKEMRTVNLVTSMLHKAKIISDDANKQIKNEPCMEHKISLLIDGIQMMGLEGRKIFLDVLDQTENKEIRTHLEDEERAIMYGACDEDDDDLEDERIEDERIGWYTLLDENRETLVKYLKDIRLLVNKLTNSNAINPDKRDHILSEASKQEQINMIVEAVKASGLENRENFLQILQETDNYEAVEALTDKAVSKNIEEAITETDPTFDICHTIMLNKMQDLVQLLASDEEQIFTCLKSRALLDEATITEREHLVRENDKRIELMLQDLATKGQEAFSQLLDVLAIRGKTFAMKMLKDALNQEKEKREKSLHPEDEKMSKAENDATELYKRIILEHREEICLGLKSSADDLVYNMEKSQLVDKEMFTTIYGEPTEEDKIGRLLELVSALGQRGYEIFTHVVYLNGNRDIAKKLEAWNPAKVCNEPIIAEQPCRGTDILEPHEDLRLNKPTCEENIIKQQRTSYSDITKTGLAIPEQSKKQPNIVRKQKAESQDVRTDVSDENKANDGESLSAESKYDANESLTVGSKVKYINPVTNRTYYGTIRWIGQLNMDAPPRIGLELEEDMPKAFTGYWHGKFLFHTNPKRGALTQMEYCYPDDRPNTSAKVNFDKEYHDGDRHYQLLPALTFHENLIGMNRGIQGRDNSCYLDSTLFSLFAFNDCLDKSLSTYQSRSLDEDQERIVKHLIRNVINCLRSDQLVPAARIKLLRTLLENLCRGRGFTSDEKDPEEFLNILFEHVFRIDRLFTLTSGVGCLLCPITGDRDRDRIPTTQKLLNGTFQDDKVKFAEVPECLIMQLPRSGTKFKMYEMVFPSPVLNFSEVLSNASRDCIFCDNSATKLCKECGTIFSVDDHVIPAFCDNCYDIRHRMTARQNHIPDPAKHDRIPEKDMELFAVLCIEISHYVAFVKAGNSPNDPWLFFDSMADRKETLGGGYNIPKIDCCQELQEWLTPPGLQKLRVGSEFPNEYVARFFRDAFVCFYRKSRETLV